MPTLADIKLEAIFGMFKGEPGTRKSTQALSFALAGDQFWLSSDRKMNALILPGRKWGINFSTIHYENLNDWIKTEARLKDLQLNANKFKGGVILDSVTTTGDNINLQTSALESGTTNKQGGEKGLRIGGIAVSGLDHYKAEAAAFMQILSILKDIKERYNIPIIIIAHIVGERKKEEASTTQAQRIIITGGKGISAKFPAVCDEVYHFDVSANISADKPPDFLLWTVSTGLDFARTALPLPRKIVFNDEPLYLKWVKPAQEELAKELIKRPVATL